MDGRRIAKEDEYDALCALIGPGDKIFPKQTQFEVEHRVVINYEKLRRMVANKRSGKDMRPARGRRRELSGTSCDFITGLVRNQNLTGGRFSATLIAKLMRCLYALEQGYLSDDAVEPRGWGPIDTRFSAPRKLPSYTNTGRCRKSGAASNAHY